MRSTRLDIGATQAELQVFHHPSLERHVSGIKGLEGEAGRKERRLPVLLKMLAPLDRNTFHGATFHAAAFCLALTYSAAEPNIDPSSFQPWHVNRLGIYWLELSLSASRTDPFRQAVTITIVASNDAGCAIASLLLTFPFVKISPFLNTDASTGNQHIANSSQS